MKQESPNNQQENKTEIIVAEQKILEIRQNIHMMGGNDSEFSRLSHLLEQLKTGTITPEDAVAEAGKIQDSKMDYH